MNLYFIKSAKLTNNHDINLKSKIEGKINPHYYCIDYAHKNLQLW